EGLAHEAETEASWLGTACLQPAIKREGGSPPVGGRQPWRKFAKQLFGTGRPLLAVNDATLARSRLLILTCRALAQVKRTGAAPRDLSEIPTRLRQDPYTGRPFAYRADGPDFVLYSVGADFKDDGGETDESFTAPDLALERPKE
ncbi:MAG: hypothetical protein HY248_03155, partial [Fimbriimonas ginsengisoli]|nr:hypothetical protein [Fimbriimonas ginsengisoli]